MAAFKPVVFIVLLCVFVLLAIWLLPKVGRGLQSIYRRFRGAK